MDKDIPTPGLDALLTIDSSARSAEVTRIVVRQGGFRTSSFYVMFQGKRRLGWPPTADRRPPGARHEKEALYTGGMGDAEGLHSC